MKKNTIKQIALQRVKTLINFALYSNEKFSDDNINTAKEIIMKYKLKIPFEYKILCCKNCKRFIVPGKNSLIRIGRSRIKAIRITCKFCGHTYRKIIQKKKKRKNDPERTPKLQFDLKNKDYKGNLMD